jgi:hypothetical protein
MDSLIRSQEVTPEWLAPPGMTSKSRKHKANAYSLNPTSCAGISIAGVLLRLDTNGPVDRLIKKDHHSQPFP